MKKILVGIGITSIIVLIICVNVYRAGTKGNITVETVNLEQKKIIENVMIPGTLQLMEEQKIYLDPEKGDIKEILVKEGDQVKKGTPLVIYENEQLELEKEQIELSLESNYIRINQLKKQIEDLEEKEKELRKEIGDKETEKQIENEKVRLETERKMASIELKQNLIKKEMIEKKLAELQVKSEVDGIVISISEDVFALNRENSKPLIHIGSMNKLKVKGVISEYDSLKIKEGQPVTLKSDVIPDQEWKGKVTKIGFLPDQGNEMTKTDSAVQYPVEVTVEDQNLKVKPGFKLIMEIETEKKTVYVIPLKDVKQNGEDHYVFIVHKGKAVKKEIKVGTVTDDYIEVTEGLTKKDEVIHNPSDDLKNGTEVIVK